jgi:putative endonuclease
MENPSCNNLTAKQQQGTHAENHACHYLQKAGLLLLKRNFRCKFGEIDLIMRDNDTLVFVEVRFRQNNYYGGALESINTAKQKRIRRAAQIYLQRHDPDDQFFWRYDWVAVNILPDGKFKIEWIPNAWEEDY